MFRLGLSVLKVSWRFGMLNLRPEVAALVWDEKRLENNGQRSADEFDEKYSIPV